MKNIVSKIEERQFITKEFADTLAGKTPAPYLRRARSSATSIGRAWANMIPAHEKDGQVCAHTLTE